MYPTNPECSGGSPASPGADSSRRVASRAARSGASVVVPSARTVVRSPVAAMRMAGSVPMNEKRPPFPVLHALQQEGGARPPHGPVGGHGGERVGEELPRH